MKYLKLFLLGLVMLLFALSNVNLYRPVYQDFPGDHSIVRQQLNYVDWAIAHEGPEQMQALYPEGAFFLYSLYTLSWIQYAHQFESGKEESLRALEKAQIGINQMSAEFSRFRYLADLNPPYGIFMNGWLNWAMGSYNLVARKLSQPELYATEFQAGSERIAQAFEASPTHYLESYGGGAWPSDNVVAVASLKLHDELYGNRYDSLIQDWLIQVRHSLDPQTGMVPYQSDYLTGQPLHGSRGNAQAVILRFLAELDPEFTREQYRLYDAHYQRELFGLLFTRELPHGVKGKGTLDSGPIIFGVGTAASLVAQIPYRIFGDQAQVDRLLASLNAWGFPITSRERTKYVLGAMPVADAFWAWGSLTEVYTEEYEPLILHESGNLWRMTYHFWSLMGILVVAMLLHPRKTVRRVSKGWARLFKRKSTRK